MLLDEAATVNGANIYELKYITACWISCEQKQYWKYKDYKIKVSKMNKSEIVSMW